MTKNAENFLKLVEKLTDEDRNDISLNIGNMNLNYVLDYNYKHNFTLLNDIHIAIDDLHDFQEKTFMEIEENKNTHTNYGIIVGLSYAINKLRYLKTL